MGRFARGGRARKQRTCDRGHPQVGDAPCAACAEHAPAEVYSGLESPAAPLEHGTRDRMESRFGFDFGRVRVHDGPEAASAADAIDAAAFTVGRDVVLGDGPAKGTAARDRLLAHELAHVVQQGGGDAAKGPLALGRADAPHEREAERAARAAHSGSPARLTEHHQPSLIQRAPKDPPASKPAEGAPAPAPKAAAPTAQAKNDDFSDCSPEKKKEIQDRANEARVWVADAHTAVQSVGSKGAKPEVKKLFAQEFRFDPEDENAKGLLGEVQGSYAKMKGGTEKKLTFTCENRTAGRAAEAKSGFLSCAGHVTIFDDFFEEQMPGFTGAEDVARDQKFRTHVLIHELAHNLAGREGEVRPGFTPQAEGCERQWPRWDALGPKDAVNNAETYALFAQRLQDKK